MSFLTLLGFGNESRMTSPTDDTDTMRHITEKLEMLPADRARYLAAFAYILGRVAYADAEISENERQKMQEIVQVMGHLPKEQTILVIEIVKNQVRLFGGTENFLVSRRFKEMSTVIQRTELLQCVFAVSAADMSITAVEEGQARQISIELGLTHENFITARAGYLEHVQALKHLRRSK